MQRGDYCEYLGLRASYARNQPENGADAALFGAAEEAIQQLNLLRRSRRDTLSPALSDALDLALEALEELRNACATENHQ